MASKESKNNSCSYFSSKCDFDINEDSARFYGSLYVSPMFYKFIIGKRGIAKKNIEIKTGTTIKIPGSNNTQIIVKGNTHESVENALKEIVRLVDYGRQNASLTHFLSIPTTTKEEIRTNFQSFKDRVLLDCVSDAGIEENIFQQAHKLHLTLSTLVLGDQNEISEVIECINRFKEDNSYLFQCPVRINIKGLGYFGNDSSRVRVLYAKVESGLDRDRLQNLADQLQDFLFNERIIMKKEFDSISLHMTLMNVSFLNSKNRNIKSHKFDCSNLINICADWEFGVFDIDEIQLSVMGSADESNYYTNVGSFKFCQF